MSQNERDAAHDFDFLHGTWDVTHKRLRERLANCAEWVTLEGTAEVWPVLRGLGNFDRCSIEGDEFEGVTLRLFDVAKQHWTVHWADTRGARLDPPLTGRFDKGVGVFYGDDFHGTQAVRVRFIWRDLGAEGARWEQAFSVDREATWETNWIMDFRRRD